MRSDIQTITVLTFLLAWATWPIWANNSYVAYIIEHITNEHNSELIIVTLVAAFAGTYGGQRAAEIKQDRRFLIEEFRNSNAAIMMVFTCFNSLRNLREQHVNKLADDYYTKKGEAHQSDGAVRYQVNFSTLQPMEAPLEAIQNTVFNKLSLTGRAITLSSMILQTINSLNRSIELRNASIQKLSKLPQMTVSDKYILACFYFGYVLPTGDIDNTYSDTIGAIFSTTLDAQFFAKLLCEDLQNHSRKLREKIGESNLKIPYPDFDSVPAHLKAKDDRYPDWINNFKE